ncbi:acetylserotonin O-methyltransferase [Desulfobotulus sp. H1]|uniref:Acetylserotonin O-methyltransferase n=1 Tax=Desulfobotulus pelophilus TaxID=2823377 RepID=A0ABT3N6M2_9BACT|nr:methyltransferase [Desulfobotulus pelophilus]MCW7753114.1 acetylserotonin O-methyltransferase [Desulfobotulus pelophilus]
MDNTWNPGRLLRLSGSYWEVCTLHTGVKLEVFTLLSSGPQGAEALCHALKGDLRGVVALLDALSAMGLLVKKEGLYGNTRGAEDFLVKDAPGYVGYMILHHHFLMDPWNRMSEAVLTGRSVDSSLSGATEEAERESFLMGMFNIASAVAPGVAKALDLSGCDRLLDFGGGPGTFAIHLCMEHLHLQAEVYDLPTTRPFAEKTIARYGLEGRIGFRDFNFHEDSLPEPESFDAVWISHILHGEGPEDAQNVVVKALEALKPGGRIFIHDFILTDDRTSPLFAALFSINMLVATDRGQSYSEKEVRMMLQAAGAGSIRRLAYKGPTESGILMGIKAG